MLSVSYAECQLCHVSIMPSVVNKAFMLNVVMVSVIMLSVVVLDHFVNLPFGPRAQQGFI
jgi:hypothetical protein